MTQPHEAPARPVPAATVVIFRKCGNGGAPELLIVERAENMRFAAGAAVFPGGRVDPEDHDLARELALGADLQDAASRIAGIRETLEETGLAIGMAQRVSAAEVAEARELLLSTGRLSTVLERHRWTLDLDRLQPFARWCPDTARPFDTRFYLADLGTGAIDLCIDETENVRMHWLSAAEVLRLADTGDLKIIFPTRRNLERLAQFASFAEAEAHAKATPVETITPYTEDRNGEPWLMIPEGLGYPVLGQPRATALRGTERPTGSLG